MLHIFERAERVVYQLRRRRLRVMFIFKVMFHRGKRKHNLDFTFQFENVSDITSRTKCIYVYNVYCIFVWHVEATRISSTSTCFQPSSKNQSELLPSVDETGV